MTAWHDADRGRYHKTLGMCEWSFSWQANPRDRPHRSGAGVGCYGRSEPVAIDVDPAILGTRAGTYEMNSGQQFRVKLEDNKLFVRGQDGQYTPLYAESETRFFVPESDYRFVFIVGEAGQVTGVSIEIQELALPPAKRVD